MSRIYLNFAGIGRAENLVETVLTLATASTIYGEMAAKEAVNLGRPGSELTGGSSQGEC